MPGRFSKLGVGRDLFGPSRVVGKVDVVDTASVIHDSGQATQKLLGSRTAGRRVNGSDEAVKGDVCFGG